MAHIDLLEIGCSALDIVNAVNALIAAHNDGESAAVVSYTQLADLPQINGVELRGNLDTAELLIAMSGCTDYDTLIPTLATKKYSDDGDTAMVTAAREAAQQVLNSKMDKDLGNIDAVDVFNGESMIPIVTKDGIKKTKLANVAVYTEFQAQTIKTASDTTIEKYRKTLTLVGTQNGSNRVFTVTGGYKTGTSTLHLNGQMLAVGKDYEETDTQTITMISYVPEAEDDLFFRAIPLE